ncbi:Uncharacterised protein [Mycobacterium tuberculosis]|nr:Uncharacterised protein [Mycobacterium tuberculosis]
MTISAFGRTGFSGSSAWSSTRTLATLPSLASRICSELFSSVA